MYLIPRRLIYTASTLAILAVLAAAAGYAEYRTTYIARLLGGYLADINESRPSTGRLWELITSEKQARSVLPDSASTPVPSDLSTLVQNHRLTIERIPDDGIPGYFAILVEPVPQNQRLEVDAGRLIVGARLSRLGLAILGRAAFDATPYMEDARKQAADMNRSLEPVQTGSIDPDAVPLELSEETDTIRTLPPDSIAASMIETFTSVILDSKLEDLANRLKIDWDKGEIQQLFLSRGLGNYQGELHYADQTHPSVSFRIPTEDILTILGLPTEEASR